jgi:hypothetical protein
MEQLYRITFYGVMTPKMEAILLIFDGVSSKSKPQQVILRQNVENSF